MNTTLRSSLIQPDMNTKKIIERFQKKTKSWDMSQYLVCFIYICSWWQIARLLKGIPVRERMWASNWAPDLWLAAVIWTVFVTALTDSPPASRECFALTSLSRGNCQLWRPGSQTLGSDQTKYQLERVQLFRLNSVPEKCLSFYRRSHRHLPTEQSVKLYRNFGVPIPALVHISITWLSVFVGGDQVNKENDQDISNDPSCVLPEELSNQSVLRVWTVCNERAIF